MLVCVLSVVLDHSETLLCLSVVLDHSETLLCLLVVLTVSMLDHVLECSLLYPLCLLNLLNSAHFLEKALLLRVLYTSLQLQFFSLKANQSLYISVLYDFLL